MENTIQEKINKYFKIVFSGKKLIYDSSSMFGTVEEISNKLKLHQNRVNNKNSQYFNEEKDFENDVIRKALNSIESRNGNEIICFKIPVHIGTLNLQDDKTTLKELAELCVQELKSTKQVFSNLETFVESYLDFKDKYDFIKNNTNNFTSLMKKDLLKELLEELNIEYINIYLNDENNKISVALQDSNIIEFNILEFNNIENITRNLSNIINATKEISIAKKQERINTYANFVFGKDITDNMDEVYGKVQDVISLLKENKQYCNSPDTEMDEEELEYINKSLDSLIEELTNDYKKEDFVRLFEHPMDGELHIQNKDELLNDLQFYYLSKVEEETNLKDININDFVMCYFDKENIENLADYAATQNQPVSNSLTDIYEELLKIINIDFENLSTIKSNNHKYTSTIYFDDINSIQVDTTISSSYTDISSNIKNVIDKYLELQEENSIETENIDMEFE